MFSFSKVHNASSSLFLKSEPDDQTIARIIYTVVNWYTFSNIFRKIRFSMVAFIEVLKKGEESSPVCVLIIKHVVQKNTGSQNSVYSFHFLPLLNNLDFAAACLFACLFLL